MSTNILSNYKVSSIDGPIAKDWGMHSLQIAKKFWKLITSSSSFWLLKTVELQYGHD